MNIRHTKPSPCEDVLNVKNELTKTSKTLSASPFDVKYKQKNFFKMNCILAGTSVEKMGAYLGFDNGMAEGQPLLERTKAWLKSDIRMELSLAEAAVKTI